MTFAFKDFDTLVELFNKKVQIILERDHKEKVEDLDNPRKYEIQFLQAVLAELKKNIDTAITKPKSTESHATIFYGAMMLISKDIEKNLGPLSSLDNSLLFNCLKDTMGIYENHEPDAHQKADCAKALNKFLHLIFVDDDSRKGIKKEHALSAVAFDKLHDVVSLSYEVERDARRAETKSLSLGGVSSPKLEQYKPLRSLPLSEQESSVTWKELKDAYDRTVRKELAKKNVSKIEKLDSPRSEQFQFLDHLEKAIPAGTKEADKIAIFRGGLFLVLGQINLEYDTIYKRPLLKADYPGSNTHTGLTNILKAKEAKFEDIESYLNTASRFIQFMMIERANKTDITKDAFRASHLFSTIKGTFNPVSVLNLMDQMMCICRIGAMDTCVETLKKEAEAQKPKAANGVMSYLNPYAWYKPQPAKSSVSEEEEVKAAPAAATSAPTAVI